MSARYKNVGGRFAAPKAHGQKSNNNGYRAQPCGEIDYDLLYDEVTRKYPKIIERLAG